MREITLINLMPALSIVTLENPKLFIKEALVKDPQLKVETL